MLPKLKYEHLCLTSFSKMRVDLAAQVTFVLALIVLQCVSNHNVLYCTCRS